MLELFQRKRANSAVVFHFSSRHRVTLFQKRGAKMVVVLSSNTGGSKNTVGAYFSSTGKLNVV